MNQPFYKLFNASGAYAPGHEFHGNQYTSGNGWTTTPTGYRVRGPRPGETTPAEVFHTYKSSNGDFHPDKVDFTRGVWTIPESISPKGQSDAMQPNEFGDKVVRIELKPNAKVLEVGEQQDAVTKLFAGAEKQKLLKDLDRVFSLDNPQPGFQAIDAKIGARAKSLGYQVIHHTDDPLYGDAWGIIDRNAIHGFGHNR